MTYTVVIYCTPFIEISHQEQDVILLNWNCKDESVFSCDHFELTSSGQADSSIVLLLQQSVAKNIGSAVRRAGVARLYGAQGAVNVQGEEQQKLDVIANQIFITLLR